MKELKQLIDKHYEIILDSIAEGVFTVDPEMRIISFNRAAEEITWISKKEAIGRECFEVLRANICETGCILSETIKSKKASSNIPVYIMRADKRRIPISVNTAVLKDSKGQVIGGVETFKDLSVVDGLRKALRRQHSFEDIVSKNEKILRLFSILPQIAKSNSTVLIEEASQGNTGHINRGSR